MDINKLTLIGTVVENFTKDFEAYGETFYKGKVSVKRQSGTSDILQVVVSEYLIDLDIDYSDKFLSISGEFRSRNVHEGEKTHLALYVFAQKIEVTDIPIEVNSLELTGTICQPPRYRETPLGREICELMLAVKRLPGQRSSYIPCIVWGRSAHKASLLVKGDRVNIKARVQSRTYEKKSKDGGFETKTAYEASCSSVKKGDINE